MWEGERPCRKRNRGAVEGLYANLTNRQAKLLQDSLLRMFQRIDAVREEHDKLDSNNRFLQKYIGDLMSTSKITASDPRARK